MRQIKSISIAALLLLLYCGANSTASAATRYVQPAGVGNGTSWGAACDLQAALAAAVSGDEIWVKGGAYLTTSGSDRSVSFVLKSGVAIYGGFGGTEALKSERPASGNVTTLSGVNSYHVVVANVVNSSAILDRFTITGGNANGSDPDADGGGIRLLNSSPTLSNLLITANSATMNGGGIFNEGGSPTLTNSTISSNSAGLDGGGMYNLNAGPTLTSVTVSGNSAGLEGGGIYSLRSSPRLTNVSMTNNTAGLDGNSVYGICAPACSGAGCIFTVSGDQDPTGPFNLTSFTVTPTTVANGSITPVESVTVMENMVASFAIKPASGYKLLIPVAGSCGGALSGDGSFFTTNTITADCNVAPWFTSDLSLPSDSVTSIMTPQGSQPLLVTVDGQGVFRSGDNGLTWSPATAQPESLRLRQLARHPNIPGLLFAATYGSGVVTSSDSGDRWSPCANTGLSGGGLNAVALLADTLGTLYAATEAGVFSSSDCTAWQPRNSGLPAMASLLAIDPLDPLKLFAGIDGIGIFRTDNGGASWTAATTQPANNRVKALVLKDPANLFAAAYEGGVYKSVNSGVEWSVCANTGLTNLNIVSLVIDAGGRLYAGSEAGVFVSADGCGTWTAMNSGLP